MHRRYLLGVCSDPHMIFCACSMQNGPHEYAVDHTSFYVISKLFTQTFLIGRGDVTFLHIAYVKSTKNVGKPTCVFGRFKNPFFLWLIQILKAVTMIMVTAIAFFWSFMRNPAIQHSTPPCASTVQRAPVRFYSAARPRALLQCSTPPCDRD